MSCGVSITLTRSSEDPETTPMPGIAKRERPHPGVPLSMSGDPRPIAGLRVFRGRHGVNTHLAMQGMPPHCCAQQTDTLGAEEPAGPMNDPL